MNKTPPVAQKIPHEIEVHGKKWVDHYFWLREKENPQVRAYIEAENEYADQIMKPYQGLADQIFEELKGRIPPDDESVPVRWGEYYYYSRVSAGQQYSVRCRRKGSLSAAEEILLDENQAAEGKTFFRLGAFEVSPDHRILAYSYDQDGSEHYRICFRDLSTGVDLPDQIEDGYDSVEWSADNKYLFYTRLDEHDRPDRVLRHEMGTAVGQDVLIFQEEDSKFFVGLSKSKDDQYLFIISGAMTTTEIRFLSASTPLDSFRMVEPRRHGVEYQIEHHSGRFLIVTNDGAKNFKLVEAPIEKPIASNWSELIAESPTRLIQECEPFSSRVLLHVRDNGQPQILILDPTRWKGELLELPEQAFDLSSMETPEFDSSTFRFLYESLITPPTVYEQSFVTGHRTLLKQRRIPSGYDPTQYRSERIFATSPDGTQVPIALVYKRGTPLDGTAPCLLYGYGSYGSSTDAGFGPSRISLLDRGFIFALAQIRGGSEMGRSWYEDGKFLKKKNTFSDFLACAERLADGHYSSPGMISIYGGSAGGLLVGATLNLKPELFRAAVARVPFVDVINTMLDDSLPLTPIEFDEWGNPKDKEYFEYMMGYSPYDNVRATGYPHLLITAGFNDPRVTYWEPAKWCAKLRSMKTDKNMLMLHTEMGAGHGGASGRYDSLKEIALTYVFLLIAYGRATIR